MIKKKKKICIVTGGRADYYLLKGLINNLSILKIIDLTILVTGQHLSTSYGNTSRIVRKDFGKICKFVDINVKETNIQNILNSVSLGVSRIGKFFEKNKPDLVILLGDRYEILSAGIASLFHNLKIAHIHGGELTIGSMDDTIRHSLTKFSHFHFVTTEIYRRRVIQLGEKPENVFNTGSLGAENANNTLFFNKKDLQKKLGIKFKKHSFLITINSFVEKQVSLRLFLKNIFKTLEKFQETTKIFTLPNSDINSDLIKKEVKKFCERNPNSFYFKSLGSLNYLSCMKSSDLVIGNSSSGIIEAPSLKIPTINIGNRQDGRVKSKSIIDVDHSQKQIYLAIKKCLSTKFKKKVNKSLNPYFKKNTALKITNIIKKKILNKKEMTKNFYDIIKK